MAVIITLAVVVAELAWIGWLLYQNKDLKEQSAVFASMIDKLTVLLETQKAAILAPPIQQLGGTSITKLGDHILQGLSTKRIPQTKTSVADVISQQVEEGEVEILDMEGHRIGLRPLKHRDVKEALVTPGLQVRYHDGKLDPGNQEKLVKKRFFITVKPPEEPDKT